jgi:predicted ester cyclase
MREATPAARVTALTVLVLVLALVLALAPALAASPPSAPPSSAPPPAAAAADQARVNKALVRRYLTEVLAAGKLDKVDEIVAKSFVDRSPTAGGSNLRGPDAARQAQKRLRELFSKVEYSPQALIAEGDQVAARYVLLATPKPERGAPPPPPPLLLNGIAVFRVRAGRIQEVFVLNDQMGLLRQLGYTLVPPGGSAAAPAPAPPAINPPTTDPPPARR